MNNNKHTEGKPEELHTEEGFTKGEFLVDHDTINDFIYTRNEAGKRIPIACTYSGEVGRDAAESNARLIASSKLLYFALKEMIKEFDQYGVRLGRLNEVTQIKARAKDAILKANPKL